MITPFLRAVLRAEGAAAALLGLALAWHVGIAWWGAILVLVAPDLSIAAHAFGPRIGATAYNLVHSYIGPLLLGLIALGMGGGVLTAVVALWAAHIGVDRALGFGLKQADGFGDTHLGRLGGR